MTRRAGVLLARLVTLAACADRRPETDAIVVATPNSPANLDPRVASEESQRAPQLNVAVFQPDVEGIRLSPILLFLQDVYRSGPSATCGGAE